MSIPTTSRTTRRTLLKSAGASALMSAIGAQFPFGVHVAEAAGPETTKAILGYIALMDASALVIAKEKGLFAKHGMPDVEVAKQAGCAKAQLVLRAADIDWSFFDGVRRLGITAGASAPEELVQDIIQACQKRFTVSVEDVTVTEEKVRFNVPRVLAD